MSGTKQSPLDIANAAHELADGAQELEQQALKEEAIEEAAAKAAAAPDLTCRIRCRVLNTTGPVNGVTFEYVKDAKNGDYLISEPVTQAVADRFARIPGYSIDGQ